MSRLICGQAGSAERRCITKEARGTGQCTRLLDIEIKPEWSESVRANLDVTLKLAKMVASFPLPDETEPAPVFEA